MTGFRPATSEAPSEGSMGWGFKPASGSPGMQAEGEDYLDDEERERVERV